MSVPQLFEHMLMQYCSAIVESASLDRVIDVVGEGVVQSVGWPHVHLVVTSSLWLAPHRSFPVVDNVFPSLPVPTDMCFMSTRLK